MTKRNPVSTPFNIWFDAQQVDNIDLTLEQAHNDANTSGILFNHVGNGVLKESLEDNILFDSSQTTGFLDGLAIQPMAQPSDNNFGNQIKIKLTDSKVAGRKKIKVGLIGLDFQNNLQYETFYFDCNESQVGKKHFVKILVLLFNDFIGDPNQSLNLGGHLIIKESDPMNLSRDVNVLSQDQQPNLFFRDFFLANALSLNSFLKDALPYYNTDSLNIFTSEQDNKILLVNDVTTKIGQKFLAVTNNIQKITLLLSVRNETLGNEDDLVWNGDLILSVYPLQSTVDCSSDLAPNLEIEFSPSNIPLAQLSVNFSSLQEQGIVLNSIPQPVDFVFSNSSLAEGKVIVPGKYYTFSLKRSGAANKCDILISNGGDLVTNSRITIFTGTLWVDLPEEDLWFQLWSDSAKVSDGQGYDSGHGITIEKIANDSITGLATDYSYDGIQFFGNQVYKAHLISKSKKFDLVQDQRTGNGIFSKQQYVPEVNLLNPLEVINLEKTSDSIFIGAIVDKNKKFYDSISSVINSNLRSATLVKNELLIKIGDDPTDPVRFDSLVGALVTNLLNGDLTNAKIVPNITNPSVGYKIGSAKLYSMMYGDVNGDGFIDDNDSNLLNTYINYNLNKGLPYNTTVTTNGTITSYNNGYNLYQQPFVNQFGISFQLVNASGNVLVSGSDGTLVANPNDSRLGQFTSTTVNFNSYAGISSNKLIILSNTNVENYGGFDIVSLNVGSNVISIRKVILNVDTILQLLRSDIDCDGYVTNTDGYLLRSYLDRFSLPIPPSSGFPRGTSNPYIKIGTRFNVLRLTLENLVDRNDDYFIANRANSLHANTDVFLNDGYFASHDFYNFPVQFNINKKLSWEPSLVVVNDGTKLVSCVFENIAEQDKNCKLVGMQETVFNSKPEIVKKSTDLFFPDDLIINKQIKNPDGSFYKVDFEVGTVILEIPDGLTGSEMFVNLMDEFVVDYTGTGLTRSGEKAMKFSDCSFVTNDALANNQIRFSVALQSFSPNLDGLSQENYAGIIVDGKIGVSIDQSTGLLTLNFTNLYQDSVLKTLNTRIQISVFLKKGGFNNSPTKISATKLKNILQKSSSSN
jgi:hypothetical protein